MQMRDSQEITEEDEVAICPKNTGQYTKMKAEYTRQIDAMGKMLQATGESIPSVMAQTNFFYFIVHQVTSMKRDREEKNRIISMLMTQVKVCQMKEWLVNSNFIYLFFLQRKMTIPELHH